MSRAWKFSHLLMFLLLLVGGCSDEQPTETPSVSAEPGSTREPSRFNVDSIARGALLFQEHCAQCHGPEAQGHPDWQHAKQRGYAAAPPLDGTGPARNLSKKDLIAVIRNGAKYDGTPVMPAWQGRVSSQDIEDVIVWFQALWPSDVYARWQRKNPANEDKQAKTATGKN